MKRIKRSVLQQCQATGTLITCPRLHVSLTLTTEPSVECGILTERHEPKIHRSVEHKRVLVTVWWSEAILKPPEVLMSVWVWAPLSPLWPPHALILKVQGIDRSKSPIFKFNSLIHKLLYKAWLHSCNAYLHFFPASVTSSFSSCTSCHAFLKKSNPGTVLP